MKPCHIRPRADADIDALAAFIAHTSPAAARRFLTNLQQTTESIGRQPGIGSKRYAHLPSLEALRVLAVNGFAKHLVFYIEQPAYIDIIRVLHSARDLPAVLTEKTGE